MIKDKRFVIGITGGIAAYKSCNIVRELVKRQAEVQVIMTRAACEFITPLTLETLSGHAVTTELFGEQRSFGTRHIELAQSADLMLIAPATYNILGKVASGVADDFLSTAISAATCPVFFAPAMNSHMFVNPILQENITRLQKYYRFIMPETGYLACGYTGQGRMAEPDKIIQVIENYLTPNSVWSGKKVLITAGPTREKIDPVRYISNFSSGKMGYALAEESIKLGAAVSLISGPVCLTPPQGATMIDVESAYDMRRAVMDALPETDILIKAAAVADYRPQNCSEHKIKKSAPVMRLDLSKTDDILAAVRTAKSEKTIVVGFALETQAELENAEKKLIRKDLDLIVINNPQIPGAGFQVDTNVATLMHRDTHIESLPKMSKHHLAIEILKRVERLLRSKI